MSHGKFLFIMLLMVGATVLLYLSLMSSIKPQCVNGREHPVYKDCEVSE